MDCKLLRLQEGDKVALIAPASGQKQGNNTLIEQALSVLAKWGLSVIVRPNLNHCHYLSANDSNRAKDLIKALTHPEIKAVFVTRGGYGCARLLSYLSKVSAPTPRYLVGFSDITTLHLYGLTRQNIVSLHAPNLATAQFLGDDKDAAKNRRALYNALFNGSYPSWQLQPLFTDRQGDISDYGVTGGCLSLLVTSLGTACEIQTAGKVLMIEEIAEAPYRIDRMLTHLRCAGKFDAVEAIVFGEMLNCSSATITLTDILLDEFANDDFPVCLTQAFGHGAINLPWRYGNRLCMKA